LERFDVDVGRADVVLALHWEGRPEYERIKALADGIRKGLAARIGAGRPIYVVLDADIAMNLGAVLREDTPGDSEVLVIDGLTLWDFDYIDLGRLRLPSGTVPVTIKSLVFADTAEGARQPQRIQCHE
jgi:ethanolamine utilization protein EutA